MEIVIPAAAAVEVAVRVINAVALATWLGIVFLEITAAVAEAAVLVLGAVSMGTWRGNVIGIPGDSAAVEAAAAVVAFRAVKWDTWRGIVTEMLGGLAAAEAVGPEGMLALIVGGVDILRESVLKLLHEMI